MLKAKIMLPRKEIIHYRQEARIKKLFPLYYARFVERTMCNLHGFLTGKCDLITGKPYQWT